MNHTNINNARQNHKDNELLVEWPSDPNNSQSRRRSWQQKKMTLSTSLLSSLTSSRSQNKQSQQKKRVRFNRDSIEHHYVNPLADLNRDEKAKLFYSEGDKMTFKMSAARTVHELRKILMQLQDCFQDGVERDPVLLLLDFLTQKPDLTQHGIEAGEIIGIEMLLEGKEATEQAVSNRRNTVRRVVYEYHRLHHLRHVAESNENCRLDADINDQISVFIGDLSRSMSNHAKIKASNRGLHTKMLNTLENPVTTNKF